MARREAAVAAREQDVRSAAAAAVATAIANAQREALLEQQRQQHAHGSGSAHDAEGRLVATVAAASRPPRPRSASEHRNASSTDAAVPGAGPVSQQRPAISSVPVLFINKEDLFGEPGDADAAESPTRPLAVAT